MVPSKLKHGQPLTKLRSENLLSLQKMEKDKTSDTKQVVSPHINIDAIRKSLNNKIPESNVLQAAGEIISAESNSLMLCACGCPLEIESKESYITKCSKCTLKQQKIKEGFLYEKQNNCFSRFYCKILGYFLYKFDGFPKGKLVKMISLVGTYIRDEEEEALSNGKKMHSFSLLVGGNEERLYMATKEEKEKWLEEFRSTLCYSSLSNYYEIGDILGSGKFGTVRLGTNKKSGIQVAIKILKKSQMSLQDIGLAKREIEIMKLCQHQNVVKLYDTFENNECIYIIMELMKGKDLNHYLSMNKNHLPEERVVNIVHGLATAVYYLHSYGIIHRDLKLDNVLNSDESSDSDVKIVDFGLSKLMGPEETSREPFGTYGYAAPELIQSRPYNKSVDIWSLGVIAYILLSGNLPFDGKYDQEIARNTISKEPDFKSGIWKTVSKEAIDCIQRMLTKSVEKRITLKELLLHPWLICGNQLTFKLRSECPHSKEFQMFTLTRPNSLRIYDEVNRRLAEASK